MVHSTYVQYQLEYPSPIINLRVLLFYRSDILYDTKPVIGCAAGRRKTETLSDLTSLLVAQLYTGTIPWKF